jgi:hypothetical protein
MAMIILGALSVLDGYANINETFGEVGKKK